MNEIDTKTERLVKMLSEENLGGVLLNAQHNFAWATGGASNAINSATENGACFLFVRADGKRFVLANNIEMTRLLTEELSAADFEPVEFAWQTEKASVDFVFERAQKLLENSGEIAADLSLNPQFKAIEGKIAPLRFALTDAEIERYRALGKDSGEALGRIFETLAPGMTEAEIARRTRDALAGFDIQPVVTLVGADERLEKYRHPVPTANVWKKVLLIAVCARRHGLIVNLSRLACAGDIPAELERKTEAVARVSARLIAATKPGATGAEIYERAAEAYAAEGFAGEIDNHHQGGATGYKTRDWVAHPSSKETVFARQAFAWNPTVAGTKTEDTLIASETGAEILTASPGFPTIAIGIDGVEYRSPGILNL